MDKWTERFAAQAKKSDENKKNIDKQVNKLLNYYNSKRPLDGRLVSWDAEMAELVRYCHSLLFSLWPAFA